MTRRESRRIKMRKQREAMAAKGYKLIQGQWIREGSALHLSMIKGRWQ